MAVWWLIGLGVGYGVSVIRSDEPITSKDRWWSMNNFLWAGGVSAGMWRNMYLPRTAAAWTAPRVLPAVAAGSGRLWALSNYIRLGAPLAVPGRTGIGFGAAVGGTGLGAATVGIAAGAVAGAAVGTGISYALWGKKGASEALGFYTGGLFGTKPNYLGSWRDPGYFHVPGNLWKIGVNL